MDIFSSSVIFVLIFFPKNNETYQNSVTIYLSTHAHSQTPYIETKSIKRNRVSISNRINQHESNNRLIDFSNIQR